jgi:hypothetical protein
MTMLYRTPGGLKNLKAVENSAFTLYKCYDPAKPGVAGGQV